MNPASGFGFRASAPKKLTAFIATTELTASLKDELPPPRLVRVLPKPEAREPDA